MAKSSGTTKSVGSGTSAASRTFNTGTGSAIFGAQISQHQTNMRNALKSFADTNGWKNLEAGTAIKTLSETDNIRTVSIKVESGYDNGKVSLYYTTNVIENLTPNYTSEDHDAFQKAISYIKGGNMILWEKRMLS